MPPTPSLPITVAFFSANPPALVELDLEGERLAIESELRDVGLGDVVELRNHSAATPNDLQRVLLMRRPTIVQFSGHGCPARGGILMYGGDPLFPTAVSGEALSRLFGLVASQVRLVVLNACYSARQAAAIGTQVDFMIGMHDAITDTAARVFAVALYRALAFGHTIQTAFDLAVNALMLEGLGPDVDLPRLHIRAGADATAVALAPAPKDEDASTWDAYLCYARVDRPHVHRLALALERRKLRVFFDEWENSYGESSWGSLARGIEGSNHGIMAISATAMQEPGMEEKYEALLNKAVMQKRLLIPTLVGGGELTMPLFLGTRHPADLRGKTDAEWDAVVEKIAGALRGQRPPRV